MTHPTLIGQLFRAHALVVAVACALLVLATMIASGVLLRDRQDRTLEAVGIEIANGIEAEATEGRITLVQGAEEYFRETGLEGYRFEMLSKDGTLVAAGGKFLDWSPEGYDIAVDARVRTARPRPGFLGKGHFRAYARWCGPDYVVRVIANDVLYHADIRRFGAVLLAALPLAAFIGAFLGRALFSRRLRPLGRLEAAAAASAADPGVTLRVEARAREIATLRDAFNGLLSRLGDALSRERRFTQEASHELRTPLAALRGRIELMGADGKLNGSQAEHVASALREVDALNALVDALLLLARSESAPLPQTPVNLCDLARAIAGRHSAQVDAPDEILVRGSEELLLRALANLVENARKFGGPDTKIRIRVTRDGSNAAVAVADSGTGVALSDRERVFERFYRAAGTRPGIDGVGLGLPVSRAIVIRHRGTIDVGGSDLGGAEFRITIPLLEVKDGQKA